MSRMAAKFDKPSSAPSSKSTKKFCSPGEDFFDFLMALGYQPSKHQKHEHFEYLFQKEKSFSLVRKLMASMKTQHCLLPEEIQRFELLKSQEHVIYGRDLETAMARKQAIIEMYNKQNEKRTKKIEDAETCLENKQAQRDKLQNLQDGMMREITALENKTTRFANILNVVHRFAEEYEKYQEIDKKLLNQKMSELERNTRQLKKDLSIGQSEKKNSQYICQIDDQKILEKEEELLELTKELIGKHVRNLIFKDAGHGIEGDPFHYENTRKIFAQYEKDFSRLKHCIIYERVNQIQNEVTLAGQQAACDKFDECLKKEFKLQTLDPATRIKIEAETIDGINGRDMALQRESEDLVENVREYTLGIINQQLTALTNIKSRSKKNLQDFFTLVVNVLKAQKVRITVIRNLVKVEGKLYWRLLNNIEENLAASTGYLKDVGSNIGAVGVLSMEGQLLSYYFTQFGISAPLDTLASSTHKVHFIVSKILSGLTQSYMTSLDGKSKQVQSDFKQLSKYHEVLRDAQIFVCHPEKEGSKVITTDAENTIRELEGKYKTLKQTKTLLVKENLKLAESNLEKLKAVVLIM